MQSSRSNAVLRTALVLALALIWFLAAWNVGATPRAKNQPTPSDCQIASTRAATAGSMTIG